MEETAVLHQARYTAAPDRVAWHTNGVPGIGTTQKAQTLQARPCRITCSGRSDRLVFGDAGQLFEIPGRPHVVWTLRDYGHPCYGPRPAGAKLAREDFIFLFRAFESGQTPPHRLKKGQAHSPTIHEYLDWTVTGAASAVRTPAPPDPSTVVLKWSR